MLKTGGLVGSIQPYFLAQATKLDGGKDLSEQSGFSAVKDQAKAVAETLAGFIAKAKYNIHISIYDFRLVDPDIEGIVVGAINKAAQDGVMVRIAFDENNLTETVEQFMAVGTDPAPEGTKDFLTKPGRFHQNVRFKQVSAPVAASARVDVEKIDPHHQIMHQKYILRDVMTPRAAVLMGSANFTIDAWAAQENNILVIEDAPQLVRFYENDFGEMWDSGEIGTSGRADTGDVTVAGVPIHVAFAPGQGRQVDSDIAALISGARERLYIASMVLSSPYIIGAIGQAMDQVSEFGGIYDASFMDTIKKQWAKGALSARSTKAKARSGATSQAKLAGFEAIEKHMHAKHSIHYNKDKKGLPHNFMHDKLAVADDALVTGSFNFSSNAERNAENILIIHDKGLADQYASYVKELMKMYPAGK